MNDVDGLHDYEGTHSEDIDNNNYEDNQRQFGHHRPMHWHQSRKNRRHALEHTPDNNEKTSHHENEHAKNKHAHADEGVAQVIGKEKDQTKYTTAASIKADVTATDSHTDSHAHEHDHENNHVDHDSFRRDNHYHHDDEDDEGDWSNEMEYEDD